MNKTLSHFFLGVAAKRLSAVEVEQHSSNQHEFNATGSMRSIFGNEKTEKSGVFIYLSDGEEEPFRESARFTWYDARENHPTRSEFRLYYSTNEVLNKAGVDDLLFVGLTANNTVLVVIASNESTFERQLLSLFGFGEVQTQYVVRNIVEDDASLDFVQKYILESIGIDVVEDHEELLLEQIIKKFGTKFPATKEFSMFAREMVNGADVLNQPDEIIVKWMDMEMSLFKILERFIVAEKLKVGFGDNGTDVDDFISFSLSVQNRRKSRAGAAFEHHLGAIFFEHKVSHSRNEISENGNRPDFIFPGIMQYRDPQYPSFNLSMLGVKTTAKERWRQILPEAQRIERKHLITLEPAISEKQTNQMISQNVQLVIPKPIQKSYLQPQLLNIISLEEFISEVKTKNLNKNG